MARTEKVIMTNMCMVFSENRVLVQDKTDDDYSGITFPGGHVERGESFTDVSIGILFLVMSILCVIGIVPYIIEVLSNINANNLSKI